MFTRFDVKRGSGQQSCKDDFVEVRNGHTDISRQIGGRYCNGNKSMLINTPRNVVRIHFHSGSTAVSISHRGFKIDFISVTPGNTATLKSCVYLFYQYTDVCETCLSTVHYSRNAGHIMCTASLCLRVHTSLL